MTEREAYEIIDEAFENTNVDALALEGMTLEAVRQVGKKPLDAFEMDSLAAMEICIAIEIDAGVTILPAELVGLTHLQDLAALILERAQ